MTENHLKFLDFVLQKLNEEYEIGDEISSIAYYYKTEKGIDFPEKDIQPFSDLYEGTYFERKWNNDIVSITPHAKQIIDNYGSLSKYFSITAESKAQEQAKIETKEQLEIELAKSNIEANKLNAKIAEQNRKDSRLNKIFWIINAVFAVINIAIAILQLMKVGE